MGVSTLQYHSRAYLVRCRFVNIRKHTIKLQAVTRRYLAQKARVKKLQAVQLIQNKLRAFAGRKGYLKRLNQILNIQRTYRNYVLRKLICRIQRFVRVKFSFLNRLADIFRLAYFHKHADKIILVQKTYRVSA